ncbi:acyltransferase [Exilibacterium tricleocarpae]|uniref:Acyltransferase n=1 Tax=Exilibacterium tricleocarpae TaxID=2591008 RepID=A0A545T3G2_9GAMM|nr:acyltransferase [Exilibacterium tricleocarpae]TQV71752.1 acyltransferase [Exilibacterium tricleocarpae]
MAGQRNVSLDLMRFLGVIIIMIAHAEPPAWLFQLRNFGTPLLIVASGLTYVVIYRNRSLDLVPFLKKRLSRLILPAWIFLTVFFAVTWLIFTYLGQAYPFSFGRMATSYTFYSGIGFVWILKVYIILALITPLALRINRAPIPNSVYFASLLLLYIVYELVLWRLTPYVPAVLSGFMNTVVFVILPYSLLYFYGLRLAELTNRQIIVVAGVAFLLFGGLAVSKYLDQGAFIPTQNFKYPPTIYYLSYAFCALNLFYLLCRNFLRPGLKASAVIVWLSSNSLWIYLWHISAFYFWEFVIGPTNGDLLLFFIKANFLLAVGVTLTYIQIKLVKRYLSGQSRVQRQLSGLLA